METRARFIAAFVTIATMIGAGLTPRLAAASAPAPSILRGGGAIALRGTTLPNLAAAHREAPLPPNRQLGVTVGLQLRDDAGLDQFLHRLYSPGSGLFHRYLTPQQFAARFGTGVAQQQAVLSWLRSSGLQHVKLLRNGYLVSAQGSVGQIERAFGTTLYSFRQGKHDFFANATPVRVPAALGGVVASVSGLSNRDRVGDPGFKRDVRARDSAGSGPSGGLTPQDLGQLYDLQPMYNSNYSGAGVTVAIPGAGCTADNIQTFDDHFQLPFRVYVAQVNDPNGTKSASASDQSECEMDVETIQSVAPGATVIIYSDTNPTLSGLLNQFAAMVTDNKADVISSSISAPEADYSSAGLATLNTILREAAAQGQTVFTSTGDNGAFAAAVDGPDKANKPAVRFPGSDPWVTSVGGTTITRNSDGSYGGEVVWSDGSDPAHPVGGGGGLSSVFYRPWWQEGPGVSNSYSNGMREIPDVAANADPNSGYTMYTVDDKGNASWDYVGGGTSASTPLWAGFGAILVQYLHGRAGFLDPTLYALGQKASTFQYAPFHDVTQGTNLYYPATPGYDLASGWGSFDATALVNALSALGGPLPQVVITGGALQHAVNGKWKNTATLKLKQTGQFAVAYTTLHAASLPVSGTATEYRNGKAVTSWKMSPITFTDGSHGFTLKLHWTKASSRGAWGMSFQVSAGSYSDSYYIQFQIK